MWRESHASVEVPSRVKAGGGPSNLYRAWPSGEATGSFQERVLTKQQAGLCCCPVGQEAAG